MAKYSKNFPHATLAALAELLALKEPPARPGYPIIEDKKLPAQQKARDEYWRTLLQTLMASQPQLAAEVMPWLSTQARAVLNSYLSAPPNRLLIAPITAVCLKCSFHHRGVVRKNDSSTS